MKMFQNHGRKMKNQEKLSLNCLCNDTPEIVNNSSERTKTSNGLVDSEESRAIGGISQARLGQVIPKRFFKTKQNTKQTLGQIC